MIDIQYFETFSIFTYLIRRLNLLLQKTEHNECK